MAIYAGDGSTDYPIVQAPVITSPASGLAGVVVALGLAVNLAPAITSVPVTGTEIRITTGPNGTGTVRYQPTGLVGLVLGLLVPALTLLTGQTYYISTRYMTAAGPSDWSADVVIST